MAYPKVHMRNELTGVTMQPHLLGHTDEGRPIYLRIAEWTIESRYLPDEGIHEPLSYDLDNDGNYVLHSVAQAESDMRDTY